MIIETQEFDYIEVKRIVQSYVKTPILHLFFGEIPQKHWDENVNYYYFVRRNNTPIGESLGALIISSMRWPLNPLHPPEIIVN